MTIDQAIENLRSFCESQVGIHEDKSTLAMKFYANVPEYVQGARPSSIEEDEELSSQIDLVERSRKIKAKNSHLLSRALPSPTLISTGFLLTPQTAGIPLMHAWNYIPDSSSPSDGKHIDATSELGRPRLADEMGIEGTVTEGTVLLECLRMTPNAFGLLEEAFIDIGIREAFGMIVGEDTIDHRPKGIACPTLDEGKGINKLLLSQL